MDDNGVVNPYSIPGRFKELSFIKNAKSLMQKLVEGRGHLLVMSAKFHCECAGRGIEYAFGRCKWWYKKYHSHSTKGLREGSKAAFGADVITLHHMRRFARKNRDYMRAYRAGAMGLGVENMIKELKTHRNALDTDLVFVSGDVEGAAVPLVARAVGACP